MPHIEHPKGWPSVTMILDVLAKPFLVFWYGKNGTAFCEKKKKQGADVGTAFHAAVDAKLTGKDTGKLTKQLQKMVDNLFEWMTNLGVQVEATEVSLDDSTLEFHGTFDAIVLINGKRYVADWKTSNQMDEISHPLQLSAYAHLWNRLHPLELINDGIIVRVDKKSARVYTQVYENLDFYFAEFMHARSLYDYVNNKGKWEEAA